MRGDLCGLSSGFCNAMLCPKVNVFHCIMTPQLSLAALPTSTFDLCHCLHCPAAEWRLWSCGYWLLRFSSCTEVCLHSCRVFWFWFFFRENVCSLFWLPRRPRKSLCERSDETTTRRRRSSCEGLCQCSQQSWFTPGRCFVKQICAWEHDTNFSSPYLKPWQIWRVKRDLAWWAFGWDTSKGMFIGMKEEMSVDSADKCFYLGHCNAGVAWKGSCLSKKRCKTKALVFLDA